MKLSDPSADRRILKRPPRLHAWLERLHEGDEKLLALTGALRIDGELRPLLAEIFRVYVPLMRQNAAACAAARARGERQFNEAAFDTGSALYDGEIDARPFRSVAKTFQAKAGRDCLAAWRALPGEARAVIEAVLPAGHDLGGATDG